MKVISSKHFVCHKEREQDKCTQTACLYKKTLRANEQGNDEICPLPGEGVGATLLTPPSVQFAFGSRFVFDTLNSIQLTRRRKGKIKLKANW